MTGKYHVIIQNRRIKFEFDLKRNITVIRGDSATGKTTLMGLIENYERLGEESGVTISCRLRCRTLNNGNWESVIKESDQCIIFMDEDTIAVKTDEFAACMRESNNYYVIITRENLPNLPYSVEEIYGIHTSGRYVDLKQTYSSFYRLYPVEEINKNIPADVVITEDTNSGYEFINAVVKGEVLCLPAGGKSRIRGLLDECREKRVLVIADSAAFGSEIAELYLVMKNWGNICLYLPESFEWIILSSGLIDGKRIADVLQHTEDYVDSSKYFSWERYYTDLLVRETEGTYLQYTKNKLNRSYLNDKEKKAILRVMEVIKVLVKNER